MALKPWREVVQPHPDVASGNFRNAEFAADLAQVLKGEGGAEYRDSLEFFRRTYLTDGMRRLLSNAMRRLSGTNGDPVVQLKTAFGGGKTHTMLALYHLLAKEGGVDGLEVTRTVLADSGLDKRPSAAVAVLVGTDIDPNKGRDMPELSATAYTLWGYMAYQLGRTSGLGAGAAWRFVEDNDAAGTAPGGDTLKQLFAAAGPCAIIIDELVAYIRNLKGNRARGGSFDSNLTFVQNLTEAVKATPTAIMVASLPESNIEVGGTAGQEALERIEHSFRRVQAAAYPVLARESFEIVRRRLFDDVGDGATRDEVCREFARLYGNRNNDFPSRTWEPEYERRLAASYPIHTEVFDRLYEDWSTNERFQRTRGVLRLLATTIHHLWRSQDSGLLITPGSIPILEQSIQSELLQYLGEGWNGVIAADVDGASSEPAVIDRENPRFGKNRAATRVARTVLMGSVPWKKTVGLETNEILLGCVEPGQSVSEYSDALSRLRDRLSYLYTTGAGRYWFTAQPNLRRVVVERESRITDDDALIEVESRLAAAFKAMRTIGEFNGVHVCPKDAADVNDDGGARLVVISPRAAHHREDSKSINFARDVLDHRGNSPRRYKNALVFAAAGVDEVLNLIETTKRYLAWSSVSKDSGALNLDEPQREEVKRELEKTDNEIASRLDPAYQWLLVPEQEGTNPITWRTQKFTGNLLDTVGTLPVRASNALVKDELLLPKWSPAGLDLELKRYIWKDSRQDIKVKDLWELFATYIYLPRLKDENTLLMAIRDGTASEDYFGYATSKNEDGTYAGLHFGERASNVFLDDFGVLIRPDIARAAAARSKPAETPGPESGTEESQSGREGVTALRDGGAAPPEAAKLAKRFYGRVKLSPQRLGSGAGQVGEEVLQHLAALVGADVEVELDISVRVPDGIPDHVVRTVSENAKTLKFDDFGFESE